MSALVVEVGVEELPSRDVGRASEALARGLEAALAASALGGAGARAFGTPRRLAALVEEISPRQAVTAREVRGPSQERAYDANGAPTPALLGFCRGQGISPADVRVVETAQGPYVMATVQGGGEAAGAVLARLLPGLLAGLPFSRSMRWGTEAVRFGRPVVWLVALLDDAVIDCTFAGVAAGRESRGHRFLSPGPVPLGHACDYADRLEAAYVLADRGARRERVRSAVEEAASRDGLVVDATPSLLDEVTDLVEWPTAFVGRFPERFLGLPDAALTTPIVHHQRQFPTHTQGGARANAFVGVRNGGERRLDLVRAGNEAVLAARLADAWFFYERDLGDSLETMRTALGGQDLGDRLGSLLDRANRVEAIAARLAGRQGSDAALVARVARLVLADRASRLVGEFPELAGVMGAVYAQAQGEPAVVVAALGEAPRPRDAEDRLPRAGAGRLVALALRAEELVAGFVAGRAPTGSEDPYGLRRAALALARIGMDGGIPGGLHALLASASEAFDDAFPTAARQGAVAAVDAFLRERVATMLVDGGVAPAVAQAVCARGIDRPERVRPRADALAAFLEGELADGLITAYRRAAHIVEQARAGQAVAEAAADWRGWQAPTEADRALVDAVRAAAEGDDEDMAQHFARIAALTAPLDRFFREVMVMDPDPSVRAHRLATLRAVVELASAHADLSRIGRRREESAGA